MTTSSAALASGERVFVEDVSVASIQDARTTFETTDLRERMARHHRDPDAAFYGWNDVWLHPEFPQWNIEGELEQLTAPLLLIQGTRDQYGTMAQLDSIEQRSRGTVTRVHLDCQHSPATELPDQTAEAIAAFTSALPPSGT